MIVLHLQSHAIKPSFVVFFFKNTLSYTSIVELHIHTNRRKQGLDTGAVLFMLMWCQWTCTREEHCFSHLTHLHTSTHNTHNPSTVTSVHFISSSYVRSHRCMLTERCWWKMFHWGSTQGARWVEGGLHLLLKFYERAVWKVFFTLC